MPFSRWLLQLDTAFIFEALLGENFFITKHNAWSVASFFLDLLKTTCLFQDACFKWEMHNCLKYGAIPGWEMYITLFERVSSLQSRLFLEVLQQSYWKMHAFFKRIDSTGKCNILQKYFDWEVTVSIPKYSMFFWGGVRYIKMQDYFTYLLHAPLEGYVIYINEKWTEWRWKNTYI